MHCMYGGVAKDTSRAEATLNSEAHSVSHCWVTQVLRHQADGWVGGWVGGRAGSQ